MTSSLYTRSVVFRRIAGWVTQLYAGGSWRYVCTAGLVCYIYGDRSIFFSGCCSYVCTDGVIYYSSWNKKPD